MSQDDPGGPLSRGDPSDPYLRPEVQGGKVGEGRPRCRVHTTRGREVGGVGTRGRCGGSRP